MSEHLSRYCTVAVQRAVIYVPLVVLDWTEIVTKLDHHASVNAKRRVPECYATDPQENCAHRKKVSEAAVRNPPVTCVCRPSLRQDQSCLYKHP